MSLDKQDMEFFFRLDSMTIKDKKVRFRTSKLNVYALKSIGLNLGRMTNSKISKASVVRYSVFKLYGSSNYKEIVQTYRSLKGKPKTDSTVFTMFLDNITEKDITSLIKKGKRSNIKISRNEILEIACKELIDNWSEMKKNLEN